MKKVILITILLSSMGLSCEAQNFTPDYNFYGNAMATLQGRFDYNHQRVSNSYGKLLNVKLTNTQNIKILDYYQSKAKEEAKNAASVDFSNDANAESWIAYFNQVFKIESIKNEMILLDNIYSEIKRLKYKDPDNFYHSKRYSEMADALNELKDCNPDDIGKIGWKYGLL